MKKSLFLLYALVFSIFACQEEKEDKQPAEIEKEAIIAGLAESEYSDFVAELEKLNMSGVETDAFTVLALPNDHIFRSSTMKATDESADFDIERHIIIGIWTPDILVDGLVLIALNGVELHIKVVGDNIYINGVLIEYFTISGNSIIYSVDEPIPAISPADFLNVEPKTLTFTQDGGTRQVSIESNVKWTVTSSQTWCTANMSGGNHNATLNITVTSNTLKDNRSAIVTLTAGNLIKTISITQSGTGGADVYVAGYGSGYARYWKNGVLTKLTDEKYSSHAFSVFVADNGDVYVAGYEKSAAGILVAKYWKNGDPATLGNGQNDSEARDIKVVGNDVYVAGYQRNAYNVQVARYWRNGLATDLTNGTTVPAKHGVAHSICIADNQVYVCGYQYGTVDLTGGFYSGIVDAKYWTNGETVTLSNGQKHAEAYSIAVKGTDIHVAGYDNDAGTIYWKNKTSTVSVGNHIACSVYLAANDVYLAGRESKTNNIAKYWKNGTSVALTDGTANASAYSVFVANSDVYVAGYEGGVAKYWKNGDDVELPGGSIAESIFVK